MTLQRPIGQKLEITFRILNIWNQEDIGGVQRAYTEVMSEDVSSKTHNVRIDSVPSALIEACRNPIWS